KAADETRHGNGPDEEPAPARAYGDGAAPGSVAASAALGVDWTVRTWAEPFALECVSVKEVSGVKPVPSNATSEALWSSNVSFPAERLVTWRRSTEPVHASCKVWLSSVLAVANATAAPTVAETFRVRPDQA